MIFCFLHTVFYSLLYRESDIQYMETNKQFHTPGIVYRPKELKNITCLLGNTEKRQVFQNFELKNLNKDGMDMSHHLYVRYLQYNHFIPAGDPAYFAHLRYNVLPETPSTERSKGRFNVFPLSLVSDELAKTSSTALGWFFSTWFAFLKIKTKKEHFFLLQAW